jgi:hypothetical protein
MKSLKKIIKISELKEFGQPKNKIYEFQNIGRLWFSIQHNNEKNKLLLNNLKAENLKSLFFQNEPSTLISISIVVNGFHDKRESYKTEMIMNSKNPFYLNCFQIPVSTFKFLKIKYPSFFLLISFLKKN